MVIGGTDGLLSRTHKIFKKSLKGEDNPCNESMSNNIMSATDDS